ncbi:MAG: helix-turn-helix domain-containing protein [Sneathiella sp.]
MKKPTDLTVDTWISLIKAQKIAFSTVESSLKRHDLPPLNWYDILLELKRVGADGLRPFQLEKELLLPQYGISRILDRMEEKGYLARKACENDGRGHRLIITDKGLEILAKMWPVYSDAIETAVGSKLNPKQAKVAVEILSQLID